MVKILMVLILYSDTSVDMELVWFDNLSLCLDYAQQINAVDGFRASCFAPGVKEG